MRAKQLDLAAVVAQVHKEHLAHRASGPDAPGDAHRLFAASLLYVLARSLGKGTDTSPLVSGLGPEGIMLQRATQRAWGHDVQGEAGKHFAAGEAHFQAGRYLEAAEAFRSSVECQESLAADLNLGAVLLNIADWGR